ncbi:arylsulfatase A family protein [Halogranum salarium B-1]|uniref:Arylsulfatase A family protein n=1 Tax=Halogranum salarium B-1 TaxID=1210908 RepID=J3EU45_9EURY|nr:arylsulfatase A family protein [Halogranum salarium B-1]
MSDAESLLCNELAAMCESWLTAFGLPRSQQEEHSEFDDSMTAHLKDLGYL